MIAGCAHKAKQLFFAFLVMCVPVAHADITHRVAFKASPQIIVWGGDVSDVAPTPRLQSANFDASVPSAPLPFVPAGLLVPATDTLEAFETRGARQASFNVASNTAFAIKAELAKPAPYQAHLEALSFDFELTHIGKAASAPTDGMTHAVETLADLTQPKIVYQSPSRTAARSGSLADQSLAFEATWDQPTMGGPIDITFTAFVP